MYRGNTPTRGNSSNFRGGRGSRSNQRSTQPKGLFADGIWHCNCSPRLPAEHFKVKKEGKNQGRWFYTCQQTEPKRCGFFLWDEDAKPREEGAVLSGKRTEPGMQEGWNAGRPKGEEPSGPVGKGLFAKREQQVPLSDGETTASPSPPPSYTTVAPAAHRLKRSAQAAELDGDDEFDSLEFDGDDLHHLAKVADGAAPMTPRKMQKTGVYATPATTAKRKLPWLEATGDSAQAVRNEDYFSTPSKQRPDSSMTETRMNDPQTPAAGPKIATASTPSPPTRQKDALTNPADDASSLTSEVLSSLAGVSIPAATLSNVRRLLTRHDLKAQGIKKGRDISRLALKAKDAKIAALHARIASLEADREVERGLGRMKRYDSEPARG